MGKTPLILEAEFYQQRHLAVGNAVQPVVDGAEGAVEKGEIAELLGQILAHRLDDLLIEVFDDGGDVEETVVVPGVVQHLDLAPNQARPSTASR